MRNIKDLPAWDRLFKKIVWEQLGNIKDRDILDFGSGEGITSDHFAEFNHVVAVEPWEDMLKDAWTDHDYRQVVGDIKALCEFEDNRFDIIICHNVLEYIEDKESVVQELARVLKPDGFISVVKHNRNGRVMQMSVLLDDFEKANLLLDGENSSASKFGLIRYYDDSDVINWCPDLYIHKTYGIRTFWDLQQNQEKHSDEEWQEKMIQLEMRVSEMNDFINIAFFHHLIIKKKSV